MIEVVTLPVFLVNLSLFLVLLMYNGTRDVSANFTELQNSSSYLAPSVSGF